MHMHNCKRFPRKVCGFEWWALIALFLCVGSLGHDPWKQDETYSFGIIYHFLNAHSWLVPMNAGAAFMEKPPIYYWTGVIFAKLFGGLLPLYDAARMASVFYMGITCVAMWGISQLWFKECENRQERGYIILALLLGSLGLVRHAHDLFTDVALLAGTCLTLLGMTLLLCKPQKWLSAGLSLGVGMGIAFLSKGFLVPVMLTSSGIILLMALPQLRTRQTFKSIGTAIVIASPFVLIWPWLLYQNSPPLFMEWFWQNNIGRFLGFSVERLGADNKPGYILTALPWFAFPSFPLAAWALYRYRACLRAPIYLFPLTVASVGICLLLLSASARALYLLPLLPVFALLGTEGLTSLPKTLLIPWNRTVQIIASIGAILIMLIWYCLLHPEGLQFFPRLFEKWLPYGFIPQGGQKTACIVALVFIGLWFASFRLEVGSHLNTAYVWFAAIALLWGLGNTLLLPWLDETRSFRPVLTEINAVISKPPYASDCIARWHLGESVGPMWEYFGQGRGLGPTEDFNGKTCPLLLLMTGKTLPPVSDPRWHMLWRGSRLEDDKDELQLYERNSD